MKGVHVLVFTRWRQEREPRNLPESASYPDASLELNEKWRAKEGEGENKRVSSSSFPWSLAPGQQSLAFCAVPRSALGGVLPECWSFRSDGLFSLFSFYKKTKENPRVNHKSIGEFVFSATPLLNASSHEPGFRDLAVPLNPLWNCRCVSMRGRACSVPEISVFPTGIAVSGLKIFRYEHFSLVTLMNYGDLDCIVLHCLLYFPHHKHPIQLQWYNFKSY